MRKTQVLLAFSLLATSCAANSAGTKPELLNRQSLFVPSHSNAVEDNIRYSNALKKIDERNIINTRNIQTLDSKYAYKGIQHYRNIDDYSDEELTKARQNELSVVADPSSISNIHSIADNIKHHGYSVKYLGKDTLIITLQESGKSALRRHFKLLEQLNGVKIVSPRIPNTLDSTPNDTSYSSQWGLNALNGVNASVAWDYPDIRNSTNVIAIVDTGIWGQHPDLQTKMVAGKNACPTNLTNLSYDDNTNDYYGHGTHVAGIAAAATNNSLGIAGVGYGSKIMPMKTNDNNDGSIYSDAARASVIWAIDNGAKVVNCSFSGNDDWYKADMVQYAQNHGIPVVCSTGNDNSSVLYPAAYSNPNVIAVGAVDGLGNRASFSNFGSQIDLCAPGVSILSTTMPNATLTNGSDYYQSWDGTSMAAPMVSGAFASLWYATRALPYWQVRDVIFATASHGSSWDQYTGVGKLNFGAAANFMLASQIVYRWRSSTSGIYGYSTTPTEVMENTYEQIGFGICPDWAKNNYPGVIPLYRKYYPTNGDRLLTTDINEGSWYNNEGIIGYIAPPGNPIGVFNVPLYRVSKINGPGRLYTKNYTEVQTLVNTNQWRYEGVVGYVW